MTANQENTTNFERPLIETCKNLEECANQYMTQPGRLINDFARADFDDPVIAGTWNALLDDYPFLLQYISSEDVARLKNKHEKVTAKFANNQLNGKHLAQEGALAAGVDARPLDKAPIKEGVEADMQSLKDELTRLEETVAALQNDVTAQDEDIKKLRRSLARTNKENQYLKEALAKRVDGGSTSSWTRKDINHVFHELDYQHQVLAKHKEWLDEPQIKNEW